MVMFDILPPVWREECKNRKQDARKNERASQTARRKIVFKIMAKPQGMHVQIRDHNRLLATDTLFRLQPGDDFRGQEESTNRDVRLIFLEQLNKWAGVEFVK